MKQETQFSLFQALQTKYPPTLVTLREVVSLVTTNVTLKENTEKFRYFTSQGFEKDADEIKIKKCPAFTPAAVFEQYRRYNCITGITQYSMVDLDDLTEAEAVRFMELLKDDPYWLLAYITISGKGLRIIYRVEGVTDQKTYLKAFYQGNAHYCELFGIAHFDDQVKDMTRSSGLCHDPNALYREEAKVFEVDYNKVSVTEVWKVIETELAKRGCVYEPGKRNDYICQAGYLLNAYGVDEDEATRWLQRRFPDYEHNRIESHIRSCYSTCADEHATLKLGAPPKGRKKKKAGKTAKEKDTISIEQLETFISSVADIRFNVITRMNEIRWKDHSDKGYAHLTDKDECTLWRIFCKQQGMVKLSHIVQIIASDFVPSYHPFQEYFDRLPGWKPGDTDYLKRLADMVTLTDHSPEARKRFERCLTKWMVAMAAGFLTDRINHEILVFIGRQGIYKTTWFHYLLPPELRAYFVPKTNSRRMSKDDRLLLAEAGLICLEEIVSMTDVEIEQIKAVVTLPQVVERAAYARNKEVRPHIASFCGTGNQINFLTDDDNRRWLPFEVADILSPYDHPIDYPGLYGQVKYLLESGFMYWFDRSEIDLLKSHLRHFEAPCLEEELIQTYYRKPKPGEHGTLVTTAEILGKINSLLKHPLSPIKVGLIMRKMGFENMRSSTGQRGYRVYEYCFDEIKANKSRFGDECQSKLEL